MANETEPVAEADYHSATSRRRLGLRKLSPELLATASSDTAAQVTRIGLTFLGTTAFCLLSLFSPDSALLGGNEKINVPLAGPVSFFGFMLLGPAVLVGLRAYLQIYVEHKDRLDRLVQRMRIVQAPTLVPLKNPLIRVVSILTFCALLPVAMLLFAWKAAVFPIWGSGLLCVAIGVITSHALLPVRRLSWPFRCSVSVAAAILAGGVMLGVGIWVEDSWRRGEFVFDLHSGPLRFWPVSDSVALLGRPFNLDHANLAGQSLTHSQLDHANLHGAILAKADLSGAHLMEADLSAADLSGANLSGINLEDANLTEVNLSHANLKDAYLSFAGLSEANLSGADLSGANLTRTNANQSDEFHVNLSGATLHLTQGQLDAACGDERTQLNQPLTIKQCPSDWLPAAGSAK